MSRGALWPSRWPAEDGGSARGQTVGGGGGLDVGAGERLVVAASRDAFACTMVVLREPGEVFLLRHAMGRRPLRDPTHAWVERIDAESLAPLARSPDLPAGPFWPGGMAVHGNGSLYVVFGRCCHRLSPELEPLASRQLPAPRPHNSFVILDDGTLAVKDLDTSLSAPARLSLLDPGTLNPCAADLDLGEPVVARLSAEGGFIYVVGVETLRRYHWDGTRLSRDTGWELAYNRDGPDSHGWDPVIAGGQLWFLDRGGHDYATTMRGAGQARGPVRLFRVSLADAADWEAAEVSGLPRGAVTDPPLYDEQRRIAVGYDSANGVVQAFRFGEQLEPLWRRELDHAAHMLLYPSSGELVMHDFRGPALARHRLGRALARVTTPLVHVEGVRRAASRRSGDDVVVLDIETGAERARARVPSLFQSVLFPAPGFGRDLYWCTFSTVARLEVRRVGT